jgi:cell division protein FtsI (penicillin-binding protein 3)
MSEKIRSIIIRYAIIYFIVSLLFVLVVIQIGKIQFGQKTELLKMNEKYKPLSYRFPGNRGKILAADGSILATTLPEYLLFMDMRVEALGENPKNIIADSDSEDVKATKKKKADEELKKERKKSNYNLFVKYIDDSSENLAAIFKDKTAEQYKQDLTKAFRERKSHYKLYPKRINYEQYSAICKDSLFRQGAVKSGLTVEKFVRRVKPFASLASRTVGTLDEFKGTKTGFELYFDNELKGDSGRAVRGGTPPREQILQEASDGMDLLTTIDIDLQDMAQNTLLKGVKDFGAAEGYAMLMEAQSGEIKAIVNLQRGDDGSYYEFRNGCVSNLTEPGSTFKVVSLMALLDEGKGSLTDRISTGDGSCSYGNSTMYDHNYNRGGYGDITLAQAIYASSNVGVSKAVTAAWGDNPSGYVDKIYKMRLNEQFNLCIPGTAKPNIRHPKDASAAYWSATTLAWMSIGYETQLPPVYTLAFFNSIANNGKYIEPRLVKAIVKNGETVKTFQTRVINEQICQPSTLQQVRETLHGVVWDKSHGTAHTLQSPLVEIAGKTGTAQISKGAGGYKVGGKKYQVSFCGFFPYDKPEYTCIVVLREPSIGTASGGRMSGSIMKSIAEKTMILTSKTNLKRDSIAAIPKHKMGNNDALALAAAYLKVKLNKTENKSVETVGSELAGSDENNESSKNNGENLPTMPDFAGWGAKDAVNHLHRMGVKVRVAGRGKVVRQNISPGSPINKNQVIELQLN